MRGIENPVARTCYVRIARRQADWFMLALGLCAVVCTACVVPVPEPPHAVLQRGHHRRGGLRPGERRLARGEDPRPRRPSLPRAGPGVPGGTQHLPSLPVGSARRSPTRASGPCGRRTCRWTSRRAIWICPPSRISRSSSRARRHRIRASSTVFQDVRYQLFAESAAAAEVTFGLSRRQASAVDTDAVLRELALDDVAGRHPATPSGRRRGRQRERFKPASRHASATGSAAARRPRRADPGRSTSPCRA